MATKGRSPTPRPSSSLLQITDLSVRYSTRAVLDGVSLSVRRSEIVALAGPNGGGKTTLLLAILGRGPSDEGRVLLVSGATVALLPQVSGCSPGQSALDRAWDQVPLLGALRERIARDDYEALSDFQTLGGYEVEERLRRQVGAFGIDSLLEIPCSKLSLGQQRKVDLAGVFASGADLLLLDEPENYLDLQGLAAVEKAMVETGERGAAILVVSHDRQLIDNVADRTLYVDRGKLISVVGGYSSLRAHRDRESASQDHQARQVERKIAALERDMRRRLGWGQRKERSKKGAGAAKPYIAKRAKKMMKRAKDVERRLENEIRELEESKPWVEKPLNLRFPSYRVRDRD